MANWKGSQSESDDFNRPPRPAVRQRVVQRPTRLVPDTEEHVNSQTEDLFTNFLYESYRNDQIRLDYDSMPPVAALHTLSEAPQSPTSDIGRQLAVIGDDLNEQYADVFADMMRQLNLTPDTAYEAFEGVAKKLFENEMNWGRVFMLLFFGYRMAMSVLRTHFDQFSSFLARITQYVVRFIVREKISKWIADQGGWRAALSFVPTTNTSQVLFVVGMAMLSVATVLYINKT